MTKSGASLVLYVPPSGSRKGKALLCAYNLSSNKRVLCSWPKREKVLTVNNVPFMYFGRTAKGKTIGWVPENPKEAGKALSEVSFSEEVSAYYYDGTAPWTRQISGLASGAGRIISEPPRVPQPDHVGKGVWHVSIRVVVSYSGISEYGTPISGTGELKGGFVEVEIDETNVPSGPSVVARVTPLITIREVKKINGDPWYRLSNVTRVGGLNVEILDI